MNDFEPPATLDSVTFDVPMFASLWSLDPIIKRRFPADWNNGLNATGIDFQPYDSLCNGDYWCTPTNTLQFARSGGDGEHYSFLVRDARINESAPVILTAPAAKRANVNTVVAPDFTTFLRLGIKRGYFALSQLAYSPQQAMKAYGDANWMPSESTPKDVGYNLDERQVAVLHFIAESLDLEPFFYTAGYLEGLQTQFRPLLKMPPDFFG